MTVGRLKEIITKYPDDKILVTYDSDGYTLLELNFIGYIGSPDGTYDKHLPFIDKAGNQGTINLNKIVHIE